MSTDPPAVSLVVSAFLAGPDADQRAASLGCVLFSLVAQSLTDWECVVAHNGDDQPGVWRMCDVLTRVDDRRVQGLPMPEHDGVWGHRHRRPVALRHTTGRMVGFLNDDSYCARTYLETLAGLIDGGCDLAIGPFVHGFAEYVPGVHPYRVVNAEPTPGLCNVGGWLATRAAVEATTWTDFSAHGDGAYVAALAHGRRVGRTPKVLYCTN